LRRLRHRWRYFSRVFTYCWPALPGAAGFAT
jgi:hypothetical protein